MGVARNAKGGIGETQVAVLPRRPLAVTIAANGSLISLADDSGWITGKPEITPQASLARSRFPGSQRRPIGTMDALVQN
jgi:hypothetical protein